MTGQNLLSSIYEILLQDKRFHNIIYKWKAYVPIVTFNYAKRDCNFEADISYSNLLALENTKLLKTYSDFDARVAPLGMAIKAWAKACKINDASSHTFSSYGKSMC
jgi:DNA polymerase sigma